MCYSAEIWADYRSYVRHFGAELSINDFIDISGTEGMRTAISGDVPPTRNAAGRVP